MSINHEIVKKVEDLIELNKNLVKLKDIMEQISSTEDLNIVVKKVEQLVDINEQLTQMHWFTTQIVSEGDLEGMYRLILNGFSQIVQIEKCALLLMDRGVGLKEVCSVNMDDGESNIECIGFQKLAKEALETKMVETSDIYDDGYCHANCDMKCRTKGVKVFSMYQRDGFLLGYLVAFHKEPFYLSEDQKMFLDIFTMQIGLSIESSLLEKKLEELAFTDGLTGLLNKRALMDRLEEEIERCKRKESELCVVMFDVDSFKHYNDTFGHPAGDVVLRKLGAVIRDTIRKEDIAARYGGEEMVVMLPDTPFDGGLVAAEKIRKAIDDTVFDHRKVTVSIGIASYPMHGKDIPSIVEMADKSLYKAKTTGKNRVCSPVDLNEKSILDVMPKKPK